MNVVDDDGKNSAGVQIFVLQKHQNAPNFDTLGLSLKATLVFDVSDLKPGSHVLVLFIHTTRPLSTLNFYTKTLESLVKKVGEGNVALLAMNPGGMEMSCLMSEYTIGNANIKKTFSLSWNLQTKEWMDNAMEVENINRWIKTAVEPIGELYWRKHD